MTLTRTELDKAQCATPGCTEDHGPLFLHGRCHISSPTWAKYEEGVVTIACAECDKLIAEIEVAP